MRDLTNQLMKWESSRAEKKTDILKVQMFGPLSFYAMDHSLDRKGIRSDKAVKLLAYLLIYRNREIPVQELMEIFWPDDKTLNPAGALKNLMYRLRAILKKTWGDADWILTGKGSYQWNPCIPVFLDAELFEQKCKEGKLCEKQEEKLRYYRQAVQLYTGRFLPEFSEEHWIMVLASYYHSQYLNCVKILACLLEKAGCYEEMEECCSTAVGMDPLDEQIQTLYLKSLILGNKKEMAFTQYKEVERLLFDNLGVRPSAEFQKLYTDMMKQVHAYEEDMQVIRNELWGNGERKGAFLCEYGTFRKVYQLEGRQAERLGLSSYLSLVTLCREDKEAGGDDLEQIQHAAGRLQKVLLESLRLGDAVSRYSANQYLIILSGCQYEDAKNVMKRIQQSFYFQKPVPAFQLKYTLDEVVAEGWEGES